MLKSLNVVSWWQERATTVPALAALAVKLYKAKPHAAGPERVFSLFDWQQAKRRSRMHMDKVCKASIISMYHKNEVNEKTPKRISGEKRKLSADEAVVVIDEEESDEIEDDLEADALSQLLQEVYEDDLKTINSRADPTKKVGVEIIECCFLVARESNYCSCFSGSGS